MKDHFVNPSSLERLRDQSAADFSRTGDELYPGLKAVPSIDQSEVFYRAVSRFLGKSFRRYHIRVRQLSHESFVEDRTAIHTDKNCIVGVLFLKVSSPKTWGPSFYEHLHTGSKRQCFEPLSRQALIDSMIMKNHHKTAAEWKIYQDIDVLENRFLIFDGHLYHSGPQAPKVLHTEGERTSMEIFIKRDELLETDGKIYSP